ncbi:MAG: sugar phosphate nucleotidyltransferase [Vicinamibacterales bacterium]
MTRSAIVLAAGLGTRLGPLSSVRAKAALPVGGDVLIRHQLRWLAAAGVTDVVVNLHHLPATITSRLGHGDDLGVRVRYSWEPAVLGSAGGPARAFDLLEADRAFIVNGDMLTDLDLAALEDDHRRHGPLVTLAGVEARPGYNSLVVEPGGALAGVAPAGRAPAGAGCRHLHFIGVQLAERRAFAAAPRNAPSETLKWLYPDLLRTSPDAVRVWSTSAAYHDIGTPADYVATVRHLTRDGAPAASWGSDVRIHPSATVENCILWDRVTVGAGAEVRDAVLADGVSIPAGLRVVDAIVVPDDPTAPAADDTTPGGLRLTPLRRRRDG